MNLLKNLFRIAFTDPELEDKITKAKYPKSSWQKDMDRIGRDFAKALDGERNGSISSDSKQTP